MKILHLFILVCIVFFSCENKNLNNLDINADLENEKILFSVNGNVICEESRKYSEHNIRDELFFEYERYRKQVPIPKEWPNDRECAKLIWYFQNIDSIQNNLNRFNEINCLNHFIDVLEFKISDSNFYANVINLIQSVDFGIVPNEYLFFLNDTSWTKVKTKYSSKNETCAFRNMRSSIKEKSVNDVCFYVLNQSIVNTHYDTSSILMCFSPSKLENRCKYNDEFYLYKIKNVNGRIFLEKKFLNPYIKLIGSTTSKHLLHKQFPYKGNS